jgi:hypothetical protein
MDVLAGHLAAEGGKRRPDLVIDQVGQGHPIPAAMFLDARDDGMAGLRKEPSKVRQRSSLPRRREKFEGSRSFHFAIFSPTRMAVKHPFLPALKSRYVSCIPVGNKERDRASWTIRCNQGYWNQLEDCFATHSNLTFSHGICPECADRLAKEPLGPASQADSTQQVRSAFSDGRAAGRLAPGQKKAFKQFGFENHPGMPILASGNRQLAYHDADTHYF